MTEKHLARTHLRLVFLRGDLVEGSGLGQEGLTVGEGGREKQCW